MSDEAADEQGDETRPPTPYRVSNLSGERVGYAAVFASGNTVVEWDAFESADDDLDAYRSVGDARQATTGVVFEPLTDDETPGGPYLRWSLPDHDEDALKLYRTNAVVYAVVEAALDYDGALDTPEDVFAACDTIRLPAERVGVVPGGTLTAKGLPESVEFVYADGGPTPHCAACGSPTVNGECVVAGCDGEPDEDDEQELATDGGRSFETQPATCPECGLVLDANGDCPASECDGPE